MNLVRRSRTIFWVVVTLLSSSGWAADAGVVRQRAELKAEYYTDAITLVVLDKDARVEVLMRRGGWAQVKANGYVGWLRVESLVPGAAVGATASPAPALLALESGRAGHGDLIATTGIRGYSKPPSSQVHALIMTIGAYRGGVPPLDGVKHDGDTARAIALRMGVPEANILMLKDQELTLDGMRKAFDKIEAAVLEDDQVFIYYSGHGGRKLVREASGGERCAESLVTVEGSGFTDAELESRLKRLSARAQKVVMFLDACHSGGATTRAASGSPQAAYTPKYWGGKSTADDVCSKPVNVLTRSIALSAKSPGSGGANFAYIAAARDNEISLDQPGKGGVASQAWLACMAGAAKDLDGSGGLSADEIRLCAQELINKQLGNVQGFLPHHVSITGNPSVVLSYVARDAASEPEPARPSPVATPASPAPVAPPPVAKPSPLAALNDIYHSRDDRRLVTIQTDRPVVRIGKDNVEFSVTSREGGYVYVLMVGSDGDVFDLLFPNQIDHSNQIKPGETLRLPRHNWELMTQGPSGKDTILAIVAEAPKDFSKLKFKPAGPFTVADAMAAKDIQLVTATPGQGSRDECETARKTRNLGVQKRCSSAYGAALLTIEEVDR